MTKANKLKRKNQEEKVAESENQMQEFDENSVTNDPSNEDKDEDFNDQDDKQPSSEESSDEDDEEIPQPKKVKT